MKVLVACEESQVVCKAFREKGHEAYSCDIQDCSGGHPEWHIKDDCIKVIDDGWDLIIAHPPCTYLSKASACRMFKVIDGKRFLCFDRVVKMLDAREFFLKIFDAKADKICIENPTPLKIANLPTPTQIIQPYMFGHPYSKRTLLWLKGLPILKPTAILDEYEPWCPSNTSNFSSGKQKGSIGSAHNQRVRSRTFEGIAAAMAEQWGKEG